jgi:CubicO group peptidase (beta-lactamase class C family)
VVKIEKINRDYEELFTCYQGNVPGSAYTILYKGKPIITKTTGYANLKLQIPVTVDTQFCIASLAKQFTATCIMILKEQDQIKYRDKIKQYIPELPEYCNPITISHLLWHTSGLVNYWTLLPDKFIGTVTNQTVLDKIVEHDTTLFPIGTQHQYCNTGYSLLATLIERTSGKPINQFLSEHIFEPLEMKNTRTALDPVNQSILAQGYDVVHGEFIEYTWGIHSLVVGPGLVYSTINDLIKWDQAIENNAIISIGSKSEAFSKGRLNDGTEVDYGFGWFIDSHKGWIRVWHGGDFRGFKSNYIKYPDLGFSIIQLSNRDSVDLYGFKVEDPKFTDLPLALDKIGTPLIESSL